MKNMTQKKRIIVFEDDESDFIFLENAFSKVDKLIELKHILAFEDLVDEVGKHGKSCLLLDLKMPQIDGLDVLKRIKFHDGLKTLPVIVFSSSDNPEDIEHSYQMGANAYAVKPSTLREYEKFALGFSQFWMDMAELPNQPSYYTP